MTQQIESNTRNDKAPKSTVSYLEAVRALGHGISDENAVANIIQRGLESTVVCRLYELGAKENEVLNVLEFGSRGTFTPQDTALVIRMAYALCRAVALIGDRPRALAWLRAPEATLAGRSPLSAAADSDEGVSKVEALLSAMGVYSLPDAAAGETMSDAA